MKGAVDMFSWIRDLKMHMSFWWDVHGGWGGIWSSIVDVVTGPFRRAWWRFEAWRRSRNPELVELDAFRELVDLERRLAEFPRAIPLLEAALKAYTITEQHGKRREIERRLREVNPKSKCLESVKGSAKAVSSEIEVIAARAIELVHNGERDSVSHFQRKLGIGYVQATQVWELLDGRGLIETGGKC